ncbi:hypothetical protein S40288_06779 [Stachybotrys chartarum IBT 40288]|nr:hypothetical protein S40288_06779 [Stachybotrys chartarum IBT 40288]
MASSSDFSFFTLSRFVVSHLRIRWLGEALPGMEFQVQRKGSAQNGGEVSEWNCFDMISFILSGWPNPFNPSTTKFSSILNLALATFAAAAPTPTSEEDKSVVLQKRASITETCNIGYASTNGGTSGGKGGSTTTVSTLAQFTNAAHARVKVKSNKTVVGAKGTKLEGVGIYVLRQKNIIIRNLAISKVKAANGDAINIQEPKNIWVDHVDLSTDMTNDKDYYDGLSYIHDHYTTSLVGHSDSNSGEDKGKLHVTYANNRWANINSRNSSVRFGTVHIYNQHYKNVHDAAVNTRMGAQVRVESTVFESSASKGVHSANPKSVGYATVGDISWGNSKNTASAGTLSSSKIPYSYTLFGKDSVKSKVASSGAALSL